MKRGGVRETLTHHLIAIKFTRSESKREIMVSLGASLSKPPKESAPHIQWFPSKDSNSHNDLTLAPDWGFGPQVYLYFAVKDTGRGLDEEEKTKLFHRFSQASPRTHVCASQKQKTLL